jgi:MFS family permease
LWELYATWAALSIFFFDFFRARGHDQIVALSWSGLVGFAGIAIGAVGCVVAGAWADRLGREYVAA